MKMFKKAASAFMALAMLVTVLAANLSVSAAGIAAQMLDANQRKFYDEMVKRFVTDFNYGSSTSFQLIGKDDLGFDETEAEVTTEDLFIAMATFVSDYKAYLPWMDPNGQLTADYPVPFLAALINLRDSMPALTSDMWFVVAMISVKDEYNGGTADMFGYPNVTIKEPASSEPVDSENLALGATVTVDSTAQQDNVDRADLAKDLANDADYTTRWQSSGDASDANPRWIALDFGEAKTFDRLRIYWEAARANVDGYVVEVSDDNETWTPVTEASRDRIDKQMMSGKETYYDNIKFSSAVTARYVRLYITAGQKGGPSVYEFEVYNGEPTPAPAEVKSIEITKAPDKTEYIKGIFAIPDLTGMELTVTYTDETTDVLGDAELKALQGFGDLNKVDTCVDEATSSISVRYLGFEATTPATLIETPVTSVSVVNGPTGEGLRGLTVNAVTETGSFNVTVESNAVPAFALDMMGIKLDAYEVTCEYGTSLIAALTTEAGTTYMYMGCSAVVAAAPQNFDCGKYEAVNNEAYQRFIATNVYTDQIPAGKVIKADYTITREGEAAPLTGSVIITKAYDSVILGETEITISDLKPGETEGYVTGVLFTNVLAGDVIDVQFSLVDAE